MSNLTLEYNGATYHNTDVSNLLKLGVPLDVINAAAIDIEWSKLRNERDQLLTGTDWTQMADSPLSEADKSIWATYRQELRDLPDNTASPNAVVWPELPTF